MIDGWMDFVHLSAQAARGRVATPCGRSNGAVAPLRVSWGGGAAARPPRAVRPATRARSARRAAQRLGSRSDASEYEISVLLILLLLLIIMREMDRRGGSSLL